VSSAVQGNHADPEAAVRTASRVVFDSLAWRTAFGMGFAETQWSRDSSSGGDKYESEIRRRPGLLRAGSEQTVSHYGADAGSTGTPNSQ